MIFMTMIITVIMMFMMIYFWQHVMMIDQT